MIRLSLLLLGASPLRRCWWAFVLAAFVSLLSSLVFIDDLFDSAIIVTTDLIGIALVLEGAVRLLSLAAIGFPNATIPVLKSLGFFLLGFISIDLPWDDNIVATVVLGAALTLDGLFRLGSAAIIRSVRWRQAVATGLIELIIAGLVWLPWPVPHRHSVPFCIGVALLTASWSLCRLGLQLRRLPPGASVTNLPLFAGPNWHARGLLHPSHSEEGSWENDKPLRVYVWTPVGSAVNPQRRLVIDRYIAAMDQGGVISTGHSALAILPDIYVSLCPADDVDHVPDEFGRLLRASAENDVPGRYRTSFAEECTGWRGPDREVPFTRYNVTALRAFLAVYQQTPIYNLTSRNCSSTVALSLDAAMEGVLGHERPWRSLLLMLTDPAMWLLALWRARAEAMTWTPGLILDYATALQHVLDHKREKWFARLLSTRRHFHERRRVQVAESSPTRSDLPAIASLIATAMIFGLTYGLSGEHAA
ncbi:MAG: HdeD family acid-resistance protein [Janthinobacterium lividum]